MSVEFFFGAMSPYSWFAAERIGRELPEAVWRPVFAGGLFKAWGRTSWGLTERRDAGIADCEARALAHGLGPIVWPDPWPTNDLLVARAMIVAAREGVLERFALSALRLAFREGTDLGEREAVGEIARRVGLDGDGAERLVDDADVKTELRRRTEEATSLGVFGIPTVAVDGELFWGDDRLRDAARRARSADSG